MIKEVKDFKRIELFNHYHKCNNPFLIITTKIDVTNIVNYCKKHKNFYATMGFLITKTANQIDAFKYRYQDNKFYYCEELKSNYTEMHEDNRVGFFGISVINNYDEYIKAFLKSREKFMTEESSVDDNALNEVWLSCAPWFSFTSLIPPINKDITIPQFIWDKYEYINEKYYVSLMIMAHHGFVDGYHIGKFINCLNDNIKNFN